jgi:imidazolonepropionase-like amidohydrolase
MKEGITWIYCGWLLDGTGTPFQKNMLLGIKNGYIECIEKAPSDTSCLDGAVDLSGCTLLPGLIDSHVHLFMSGTVDTVVRGSQQDMTFAHVKPLITQRLARALSCGVVAVRDGGDAWAHALRYGKTCHDFDELPVQIKAAGKAWHQNGRYGKFIGRAPVNGETLAAGIRKNGHHADHVKILNSGINSLDHFGRETPPQFSAEALQQAVLAAKSVGCKTMVHANGREPVAIAIQAGCHSIEHGFFMGKENLQQMADQGIVWVPTAVPMHAYHQELMSSMEKSDTDGNPKKNDVGMIGRSADIALKTLTHQLEQMCLAKALGVTMALGTDAGSPGVHHGSAVRSELQLFMTAGYSVAEAIQCATQHSAHLLGLMDYGTLTPGKIATLIAVPGGPRDLPDSLGRITALVVQGREYAL